MNVGGMSIGIDGTFGRQDPAGTRIKTCNIFNMDDDITNLQAVHPLYVRLCAKIHALEAVITELIKRFEELYFAPGMPGFIAAQVEFNEARARAEATRTDK